MKARMPHLFYTYASQFSLKSIVLALSGFAMDLIKNQNQGSSCYYAIKHYRIKHKNSMIRDKVPVYQVNLIDVMYEVVTMDKFGQKAITQDEALYLVHLHVNLVEERHKRDRKKIDIRLWLEANLGEQTKFQKIKDFFDDYSREKYILEIIGNKEHPKNQIKLDFNKEFSDLTGVSTDHFSFAVFLIYVYFSTVSHCIDFEKILPEEMVFDVSKKTIMDVLKRYSVSVDEIKVSNQKRQTFYLKPILRMGNEFIAVNPLLLLETFSHSNYWIVRNEHMTRNSQAFINYFGKLFEIYLEEVLNNCLTKEQYQNIEESNIEKRADWHLNIEGYEFFVEQKSSLSLLSIKQSQPDLEAMKKHICKVWGKAAKQLAQTEKYYKSNNAIKIILTYEGYYGCTCIDQLFKLDSTIVNDGRYWLMSIKEFEEFIFTYKTNPKKFFDVVEKKTIAEKTQNLNERGVLIFLKRVGVKRQHYINAFGISGQFNKIAQTLEMDVENAT